MIYNFTGEADGAGPGGNLLFDSSGRLYGTALIGGTVNSACFEGYGTIFRLTNASGTWRFARLFNFQGLEGGSAPLAIVFDSAGNIYGTADSGGTGCGTTGIGCGTVFKLTPANGAWREKVLHAFTGKQDGSEPNGFAFDSKGNAYWTSFSGASMNEGVVWELSPTTTGPWTFTQVIAFGKASDGYEPNCGVILDSKANLYGANSSGGADNGGTVFELSPPAK